MATVISFELDTDHTADVSEIGRYPTMAAASADLPAGAYTTFRTYSGNRVLRLGQHFRRLEESAALMGQHGSVSDDIARNAIARVLSHTRTEQWATPETRLRLTFAPPQLFVTVEPFQPYAASLYENGVRCVTVSLHRDTPHAKSTRFIASAADAYKSLPADAHEGLMLAEDGSILEGLSSNFFAITEAGEPTQATLFTEETRVLLGVTRSLVLEVASAVLPLRNTAIHMQALAEGHVRECFITSVSREILPVVQVDAVRIHNGLPGPITRTLMQNMATLIHHESEPLYANPGR